MREPCRAVLRVGQAEELAHPLSSWNVHFFSDSYSCHRHDHIFIKSYFPSQLIGSGCYLNWNQTIRILLFFQLLIEKDGSSLSSYGSVRHNGQEYCCHISCSVRKSAHSESIESSIKTSWNNRWKGLSPCHQCSQYKLAFKALSQLK